MHAFLLVSDSENATETRAKEIARDKNALFIPLSAKTVKDVDELKHTNALSHAKPILIFISSIDTASHPAQNALLKLIEEPQKNITFVLGAKYIERVLATIRSRASTQMLTDDSPQNTSEDVVSFFKAQQTGKLAIVSRFYKRQDAIEFLNGVVLHGHKEMLAGKNTARIVEKAILAADAIAANANPTLQLTNFVIQTG